MMYLGRRNQGCITLLASVIPPYKTHMIVLANNSPLTDDGNRTCNARKSSALSLNKTNFKIVISDRE
jgi:hypothetical protein